VLRRLLVEDVAGTAWRQMGFAKSPMLKGPDLLAALKQRNIPTSRVAVGSGAGVRYGGMDTALMAAYRIDNPSTGVSADANEGFAVALMTVARKSQETAESDFDLLIERSWFVSEYLDAAGFVRRGETLSRREVIKHMANDMGGVHLEKNTASIVRHLLVEAEHKLFIEAKNGTIRSFYIEVLAIGQAVGRSDDFKKLASTILGKIEGTTTPNL
jgi:hypothetical protein